MLLFESLKELIKTEKNLIAVAVPNGGVPVAIPIVKKLKIPLYFILSKKISLKGAKYIGLGAVSSNFEIFNRDRINSLGVSPSLIQSQTTFAREYIDNKHKNFSDYILGTKNLSNKTVLIIDDGVASGYTILSTIKEVNKLCPNKIIIATPVVYSKTKEDLDNVVSKVYFIESSNDERFVIDDYYSNFIEITDQQVLSSMNTFRYKVGV